jgi:hypothetical protein
MKAFLKHFTMIFCLCCWIQQVCGQGYIVPNGVTYIGTTPFGGSEFHVIQNPANSDYTGFLLPPQVVNTFSFGVFLDEGVRVFLLSPNDPVSLQSIQANSYTELGGASSYTFSPNTPFYVGLYSGYGPWDSQGLYTGIYRDPVFGWAELVNDGGTIKLLDSALAYGADGIYAGTRTLITIPEPSTLLLTAVGGALALARRIRNQNPSR